jgi:phosphoenolpyruvate-protein phosphotransferase (PTS system enzyme I)
MEYNGIIGSSGTVIGRAYIYKKEMIIINKNTLDDNNLNEELHKVDEALILSRDQINKIKEQASKDFSKDEAAIFEAHLMILEDPELIKGIKDTIIKEKIHSSNAASKIIGGFVDVFLNIEDEYLKERAADIRDVGNRLINNLLGIKTQDIGKFNSDVIIVAHDLTPSDTALMDKKHVKGFMTNIGGKTSHTAIMARRLEIPAILGLGDITEKVQNDDIIIIDGSTGSVIINPDEDQIIECNNKIEKHNKFKDELKSIANMPAFTIDGKHIEISANIGGPSDIDLVVDYGGDGVGLYRTEFLYMDRDHLPSEDEQFKAYLSVAEKLVEKPVIIRTLDIGGDKKLPYLPLKEEMNPFLGFRAIRICLEMKDMFKTQLRAILRASIHNNVLIMYPMISSVDEVIEANKLLEEVKCELRIEGIAFDEKIKCGVMIEIPSAAITADIIIKEVDFFSIGTNDLCQYTLAVDRMNEKISNLYQPFHPGVLRLIKNVIDESHKAGKFTGMCGELAGDPVATLILLGLGLDEFSMSASSLLLVKKIIQSVSLEEAKTIAEHALTLKTSSQIQEYLEMALKKLNINID